MNWERPASWTRFPSGGPRSGRCSSSKVNCFSRRIAQRRGGRVVGVPTRRSSPPALTILAHLRGSNPGTALDSSAREARGRGQRAGVACLRTGRTTRPRGNPAFLDAARTSRRRARHPRRNLSPLPRERSPRLASAAHSGGGGDVAGSHANRFEPPRRVSTFSPRRPPGTPHTPRHSAAGGRHPASCGRGRSHRDANGRLLGGLDAPGAAAEQRADLEAAADAYRHAIDLNAGIAENFSRLGRIEEKLGRSEPAKANFEKASLVTEAHPRCRRPFQEYTNASGRATIDDDTRTTPSANSCRPAAS